MRAPLLSEQQILAAADEVAQRDGLDQLTIRNLCAQLGVTAPAVYRHFPTKDVIVNRLIDEIIGRIALPGPDHGDWADRIRTCFVSAHDEVGRYAGLAARMSREMPNSANAVRNSDYLMEVLADGGVPLREGQKIIAAVFVYIWGHLLAADTADVMWGGLTPAEAREQFLWGLDHLLASFRREFGGRRRRRR